MMLLVNVHDAVVDDAVAVGIVGCIGGGARRALRRPLLEQAAKTLAGRFRSFSMAISFLCLDTGELLTLR
jgi:hypothetical protein